MTENPIALLVREARDIDASLKELAEKKAALVERIKTELGVGGTLTVDSVRCTVRPGNRKFSIVLACDILPADVKLTCVSTVIDEKKIRSAVEAMGAIEACMEAADPSKTILDLAK